MSYQLHLNKRFVREVDEVRAWYEDAQTGLGERFIAAVRRSLSKITKHPRAYRMASNPSYRRFLMRKFSYIIYYRIVGRTVVAAHCYHKRRKPLFG